MTETAVPIAAACTSSLSVRNHQKCSQKELTALLHTARYGTKVEVRVREKVSRTNADGSSDSVQNNLSGTARSTTQEQADPDTCFRWKVGRISQVSPDIVSVRFPNGADVRVPWIRRDVKLFRHSPSYQPQYSQDSDRSYEEHSISHNSASTINDSDNLNWNSNSNRSSSRVEPESSSSAAADFLLQNYDSDSDDDRYNDGGEGSERERAVDTLSAAFEHGDFSEYTDRDGEEVERGLELCGAGGTEGRSGGHEGLLGLENLLMQYQGERGNEEEDRGCEFLGNTVQGFESGSSGISSDQGPSKKRILSFASSSAAGSGDVNSSNIEYVSGEHDATADVAKAREENDRYEALCRLQDEDAYFARLNLHSKNGTTKIFQGPYSFDYAEQKGEIKKRKRLSFLGASNTDDQGHEEGEGEVINPLSVGGQVNVPLGPEEDPTHPIPPPDVCVYGRLGKVSSSSLTG